MEHDEKKSNSTGKNLPRRKIFSWFWKVLAAVACIEFGWVTGSILTARKKRGAAERGAGILDAGMVNQFQPGDVKAVPAGQFYLVCLEDGSFIALSRTCTHLGCAVPWDGERGKFVCPCHGSTYDKRGVVLTPPATRPLDYYPVKIENGLIRIDTSRPLRRDRFENAQTARA